MTSIKSSRKECEVAHERDEEENNNWRHLPHIFSGLRGKNAFAIVYCFHEVSKLSSQYIHRGNSHFAHIITLPTSLYSGCHFTIFYECQLTFKWPYMLWNSDLIPRFGRQYTYLTVIFRNTHNLSLEIQYLKKVDCKLGFIHPPVLYTNSILNWQKYAQTHPLQMYELYSEP